jgi:hypothetical protein
VYPNPLLLLLLLPNEVRYLYNPEKEEITFWEGSTTELLQTLNKIAQTYKVDTDSKLWPKAANSLTRRLKHILSNLRKGLGIHVIIGRNTGSADKGKKNTSTVKIEKISPLLPLSPPGQNHDQNQVKSGGDIYWHINMVGIE